MPKNVDKPYGAGYDLEGVRKSSLSESSIGIKVADGSFYPVLEEDFRGRKRLILTTVRDNQTAVQIDLYRGEGREVDTAEYIGSLIIENLQPLPKGDPDIEVVLGVDEAGSLNAVASDCVSGEKQSLSVSLESLSPDKIYEIPEFAFDRDSMETEDLPADLQEPPDPGTTAVRPQSAEVAEGVEDTAGADLEEELIAGESYPVGARDSRREYLERRKRNPLLLALFILLALLLIAGVTYLVYRSFGSPQSPVLQGEGTRAPATAETAPVESQTAPVQPVPAVAKPVPAAAADVPFPALELETEGVWYKIVWGDTLWDLSATFYRTPWLYQKLARANAIHDPDLIIAGTLLYIPKK
jgi:nucleoid-associated protein YgaU